MVLVLQRWSPFAERADSEFDARNKNLICVWPSICYQLVMCATLSFHTNRLQNWKLVFWKALKFFFFDGRRETKSNVRNGSNLVFTFPHYNTSRKYKSKQITNKFWWIGFSNKNNRIVSLKMATSFLNKCVTNEELVKERNFIFV